MKKNESTPDEFLEQSFARFRNMPSTEIQPACDRVLERLRNDAEFAPAASPERPLRDSYRLKLFLAAAAVIAMAVLSGSMIQRFVGRSQADATAETGKTFRLGETIRSNGAPSTTLTLRDNSRIEMRSNSELVLESAADGVRIRLNAGSVIVTAAKQRAGHLYVQTKDVTVSVVGTIFLVNTEAAGSRVAVIQGEVKVQQGATAKQLRQGEEVASNPGMTLAPVREEVSWSRQAEEHRAMLEKTAVLVQAPQPQPPEPRIAFEVVSIRPAAPQRGGGGRGGPGTAVGAPSRGQLCLMLVVHLDPGRFATTTTALDILATAYGKRACSYILGAPDWLGTDRFDVQATMPEGSPAYTLAQARNGNAPRLQLMLQTMLAERFHLAFHRETRELPVYNLVLVKEGKMVPADDQTALDRTFRPSAGPNPGPAFGAGQTSIQAFADLLTGAEIVDRPVIDKTGLKGTYNIFLSFPEFANRRPPDLNLLTEMHELIPSKLQEDFGLKLEPARGPVEFIVIDHVEKPSEN